MRRGNLSPWLLELDEFPVEETRSARLEYLVNYAVLAPSTHNSQPWRFRVRGEALELLADRQRALRIADPLDRELTISCGAALQFARLAARKFSWEACVELMPDPANPDLLARLRLGAGSSPTKGEVRRFDAIAKRHTNRTRMNSAPSLDDGLKAVMPLARHYGIAFASIADDSVRSEIADLVADADRRLMADASFRNELARWVRSSRSSKHDGMSLSSFGMGDELSALTAFAIRNFEIGGDTAETHRQLVLDTPVMGLLVSLADDPKSWLRTGMALADILLELTARGFACSFANQPLEVAALRPRAAQLFQTSGFAQMLVRIGCAEEVPAAARRCACQVLE